VHGDLPGVLAEEDAGPAVRQCLRLLQTEGGSTTLAQLREGLQAAVSGSGPAKVTTSSTGCWPSDVQPVGNLNA
jgi:hypothetical protein